MRSFFLFPNQKWIFTIDFKQQLIVLVIGDHWIGRTRMMLIYFSAECVEEEKGEGVATLVWIFASIRRIVSAMVEEIEE